MILVVDASAVLAWLLPSQSTRAADAFLLNMDDHELVAPFIFDWEVRNVLVARRLAERLAMEDFAAAIAQLADFEIAFDEPHDAESVSELALHEGLTLFDAAYLATALAETDGIVSRDRDLLTAAERRGLAIFDLS